MDISIFLAKAWGLYFIIMALAMLLNKKSMDDMLEIAKDKSFLYLGGFMALTIGILSVLAHNIWTGELWVILVTIFGWLSLVKGVSRFLWPDSATKWVEKLKNNPSFMYFALVVMLVLGLYVGYMGFWG